MVLNRYVTKQKELSSTSTKTKQTNRNIMASYEYPKSIDFQGIYVLGLLFAMLTALLVGVVYINNPANPSNEYFFIIMFGVFTLTSTFSAIVAKEVYINILPQFYIVFVLFFNIAMVFFVIAISSTTMWPNGMFSSFLEQSGLGINLRLVIYFSIVLEFLLDGIAYIYFAVGAGEGWPWLFLLIELTLLVLAIVPSVEVFSSDAIMLAGVLSLAHIIESIRD